MKYIPLLLLSIFTLEGAKDFSLKLKGHCFDSIDPILGVQVYVTTDTDDFKKSKYHRPTSRGGGYDLQFNVTENKLVDLWYVKDGYTILNKKYTPRISKKKDSIEDTFLLNLKSVPTSKYRGSFNVENMIVYQDYLSTKLTDTISLESIKHFSSIERKYTTQYEFCNSYEQDIKMMEWYKVMFYLNNQDTPKKGWVLYEQKERA